MFSDIPNTVKPTGPSPTTFNDDNEESEDQNRRTSSIDDTITAEAVENIAVDLIDETVDQLTTQVGFVVYKFSGCHVSQNDTSFMTLSGCESRNRSVSLFYVCRRRGEVGEYT